MLTRSVVVVVAAQVRFLEQGDYVLSAFINSQPVRNTPAKFHVVAKDATHREMEEEEQELEALKQARGADMDFEVDSDDDDDDDAASCVIVVQGCVDRLINGGFVGTLAVTGIGGAVKASEVMRISLRPCQGSPASEWNDVRHPRQPGGGLPDRPGLLRRERGVARARGGRHLCGPGRGHP
eukprot:8650472-Pyramimonas_sp.AAC.2